MQSEQTGVIDAIPALVWTVRVDGQADFLNQRWLDYTGLSLEEALGSGWQAAICHTDLPAVLDYFRALQPTGQSGSIEARMRRFDGAHRWFLMQCSPLRDGSGAIVRWSWYVSHSELDERKRTEALLAGEKRVLEMVARGRPLPVILDALCAVVEAAAPGCRCSVLLIDPRRSTFHSGAAPTLPSGYTTAIEGAPVTRTVGPCGMAASLNTQVIVSDIASDARWDRDAWPALALAHDLRSVWSTPILSLAGNVLGTFALYQQEPGRPTVLHQALIEQFTHVASIAIERAQTEAALRRSQAFLAEAQRLSSTGSFAWRANSDEVTWSEELYRIHELDPSTPMTLQRSATRVHPDDMPLFIASVENARRDGRDFEVEPRLLMPDGSIKHVHIVAHATRDETGALEYIGALQDVTERRQSQDALDKARSELARVARVTSLGVLTASIAHEVNQPLSGILTNASTGFRMLADDPPNVEGARETARRTMRDARRAADVIARLRALFTKNGAATESVDLNEATREVIALSSGEWRRAGVIVRTELAGDLPLVAGDRVQLQQVVLNLMLNASESMSGVEDRPRLLTIRTGIDDDRRVRVSVRDVGVGIDPQNLERLFEAFYSTKSGGMGIGLSVSRSIIARHNGRLWAAPNEGLGATFAFSLPAAVGAA
jgi:PAS domain S-box-containing protein